MLWCTVCSIQQECVINTIIYDICIHTATIGARNYFSCGKNVCLFATTDLSAWMCVYADKEQTNLSGPVDLLHHDIWKELHRRISREQLQADAARDTIEYCL